MLGTMVIDAFAAILSTAVPSYTAFVAMRFIMGFMSIGTMDSAFVLS